MFRPILLLSNNLFSFAARFLWHYIYGFLFLSQGDFTCLEEASGSVDKVYACEATCHARDKSAVFGEAFRVLKPGGLFANYDWLVTAKYDPDNHEHAKIVHDIMVRTISFV